MSKSCFSPKFVSFQLRMLAAAACLLMLAGQSQAADTIRYRSTPGGSKVKVDGKANIHEWTLAGDIIAGSLEVPAGVDMDPAKAGLAGVTNGKLDAKADISIPVTSLRNTGGYENMDNVMEQAMKADDFKRISFHLTEMVLKEPHAAGTPLQFDVKGDLGIAGVTNKIAMPVSITSPEKGKLKISASVPVKMTSYNIKPPVKLGIFITEDGVVVSFDWLVNLPTPKPAAP